MTAMKKMILAISMEAPAMPPKPRIPAINATTRNVTTQLSMTRPLFRCCLAIGATAASRIDCRNNPARERRFRGRRNREICAIRRNKIAARPRNPACERAGINLSKRPDRPYMALNPCYEGSPSPPHGAIVGPRRFAMTEPSKLPHHGVPEHQPAAGGIAARARAAAGPQYLARAQSRAARGGGDAGRPGAGAGRRRHRQDPRADHAHRPHPEPGPRAAAAKSCR